MYPNENWHKQSAVCIIEAVYESYEIHGISVFPYLHMEQSDMWFESPIEM